MTALDPIPEQSFLPTGLLLKQWLEIQTMLCGGRRQPDAMASWFCTSDRTFCGPAFATIVTLAGRFVLGMNQALSRYLAFAVSMPLLQRALTIWLLPRKARSAERRFVEGTLCEGFRVFLWPQIPSPEFFQDRWPQKRRKGIQMSSCNASSR